MWLTGEIGSSHWVGLALFGGVMLNVLEGGRRKLPSLSKCKVELHSLLHSFPDAVFLFDPRGRVADWNHPAQKLATHESSDLLGIHAKTLSDRLVRDDKTLSSEPLGQRALTGKLVCHERCLFRLDNGDWMEVLVSESPIRDTSRRIIGALVVFQDVTELSALQRQVASSERHFAVGQMTAGLAHDFNNVLHTISEATYVMEGEHGRSDHDRSMLAIIQNGVRRGAEIVGNIRDYLLGNREAQSRVDMRRLLEEVLQLAKPLLDVHQNITVSTEFVSNCEVCGNAPELRRVFINLILNAIDAMPQGGTLAIACSVHDSRVVVRMKDSGSGIAYETQKLIFLPYFTTKPQGTGLGLAGARRTVQAQGGDIQFESSPGEGTTFYVDLPIATDSEQEEFRAA
jgi:PAS domain S-box-containing protein